MPAKASLGQQKDADVPVEMINSQIDDLRQLKRIKRYTVSNESIIYNVSKSSIHDIPFFILWYPYTIVLLF